jgi:phosphotriesterase-related protein
MSEVQTVRGPVDGADLGVTLMHEHVFVLSPEVQANFPENWGSEEERVADAIARLQKAYDAGVRTLVDPTVIGLTSQGAHPGAPVPGCNCIACTISPTSI